MNIFVLGIVIMDSYIEKLKKELPGVAFVDNFEQVIALVKEGSVDKICLFRDVWNCTGSYNQARAQVAAKMIHKINPDIPILIWDGREYDCPEPDSPPCLQCWGKQKPITEHNELYLDDDIYFSEIPDLTRKFFSGKLTEKDVPVRECLEFSFSR